MPSFRRDHSRFERMRGPSRVHKRYARDERRAIASARPSRRPSQWRTHGGTIDRASHLTMAPPLKLMTVPVIALPWSDATKAAASGELHERRQAFEVRHAFDTAEILVGGDARGLCVPPEILADRRRF